MVEISKIDNNVGRVSISCILISGLFLRTCCASDETYYLADRAAAISSASAETSSHYVNGVNGSSSSSFYYRNLRELHAFDDEYGGVIIDPHRLPSDPYSFAQVLGLSLYQWKKMVSPLLMFWSP